MSRYSGLSWAACLLALAVVATPALAQSASAAAQSSMEAKLTAIEAPTIIGSVSAPEMLEVGRALIRPAAGSKLHVFAVDGEQAGFVLDGAASLVYRVEDTFSVPHTKRNLEEADGIETRESGGVLELTTALEGAAVWGWDLEFELDSEVAAGSQPLPEWLAEILEEKYSANPGWSFLHSKLHGDAGYRWAVMRAKREDLLLDVDPGPGSMTESLWRLSDPRGLGDNPFSGRRFMRRILEQPVGRTWWEGEAVEFVSTETDIDVLNAKEDHVQVTTRTRLQVQREGLRVLTLSHINGTFVDSEWEPFHIRELKLDGKSVDYAVRGQSLLIPLPAAAKAGDSFQLEVKAEGNILVKPSGDNYWRLGIEAWYPRPGGSGEEWAEIRINAKVLAPYTVFAAGEIVESSSDDSGSRVKTRLAAPMGYAMVVAGKYQTVSAGLEEQRVHISSYAAVKEKEADRVAQVITSSIDCMNSWLGVSYPFQDLQIVELNQWGWAQAPPGMIFVTQEAFLTRASARLDAETLIGAAFTSRNINERLAHEVAHAWFPHVAKIVRWEENWLSESLADYVSAVCIQKKMANKRKGRQSFERQLQDWKNLSELAGDATSVFLAGKLTSTRDNSLIQRALLYGRGPLALHSIRLQLQDKHGEEQGDALFFTWLRSYVKNFTFKVAESRHLLTILNQVTKDDWKPFFERYIFGAEEPPIGD